MHCRSPGPHTGRKLRGLAWGVSRPTMRGKLRGLAGGLKAHTQGGKLKSLAWGVSRPTSGVSPGPHLGGSQAHTQGGITAYTEADPPPQMATAAGGTHPTGMHSCYCYIFGFLSKRSAASLVY